MRTRDAMDWVVHRLREAGGITVEKGGEADLLVGVGHGPPMRLFLEFEHRLSSADLQRMVEEGTAGSDRVLVTYGLSESRREELRRAGLSWIEYSTGCVHLRVPGMAIDLPTTKRSRHAEMGKQLPDLSGKAGLIAEALVTAACENPVVRQSEIAAKTGSTQAWVSRVFRAFVETGALSVSGSGPRKVWTVQAEQLLDLWVETGGTRAEHSTGLYIWTRNDRELLGRIAQLSDHAIPYAVGGPSAADLYEPTLTTQPHLEIWIPASIPPRRVASVLEAEVVESGRNVTLWQASGDPSLSFCAPITDWREPPDDALKNLWVVSPARAVVEASQAEGRGPEVASRLREALSSSFAGVIHE